MPGDRDPVVVSACRTPIGKIGGALSKVRPDDLLAFIFAKAVAQSGLEKSAIDEAYAGCANQAGEDNRNVARMSLLLADFPHEVPGVTVNRLCASGLEAVVQGARSIMLGDAEVVLCGGTESMTRAPYIMAKSEFAFAKGPPPIYDSALGWRFENPELAKRFPLDPMGVTAENLVSKFGISREAQDHFAFESHQKALQAQDSGWFDNEIEAYVYQDRKGKSIEVSQDEGPRKDTTLELLAGLKPIFKKGGSVTAGNSSSLNDGASALVITSRAYAKTHGLKVLCCIKGFASAGVDPQIMGIGPVAATHKLFEKTGLKAPDIDLFELNEAFAAQALSVIGELELPKEKVNIQGGAIALGHPLGCSGARILTTLINALGRTGKTLGVASLCVGVGQGLSMLIEREGA